MCSSECSRAGGCYTRVWSHPCASTTSTLDPLTVDTRRSVTVNVASSRSRNMKPHKGRVVSMLLYPVVRIKRNRYRTVEECKLKHDRELLPWRSCWQLDLALPPSLVYQAQEASSVVCGVCLMIARCAHLVRACWSQYTQVHELQQTPVRSG